MGCGASSPATRPLDASNPARPPPRTRTDAGAADENSATNATDATHTSKPEAQINTENGGAGNNVDQPPAPSKASMYAVDGLNGAAVLVSLAPLPGSAPLSSVLRRCADLISSASSRPQWLADFHAYLVAVHEELTAATGAFSRQSHLELLTAELTKAEQSLKEITARSWLSAAVHSSADAKTMKHHREQCERIKQQALVQMLSEAKADSKANKKQAQQIQAVLAGTAASSMIGPAAPQSAAVNPGTISAPSTAVSSSSTAPESALSSLSAVLAFVPIASASSLSASLDRCLGIIASIRSRSQWLAEFERYLASVRGDLASASAAFSRSPVYLTALSNQLSQSEKLLRTIAGRSAWKAPLCAAGDRQALQAQQAACEKIKSEALSAMLTEMQADSTAVLSTVAGLRKMLAASEQSAQKMQAEHDRLAAEDRLMARLQPIDFTADVDRELDRFMPGTRANIISSVDRWLHFEGAATAAATAPAGKGKGKGKKAALAAASASEPTSAPTAADSAPSASSATASSAPASSSRLCWIRGGPGAGKSCVSAKLIDCYSAEILAVHFCRHDSADRRDPRRLVKSLSQQIAQRLPAYAEKLHAAIPAVFGTGAAADNHSASDLWQQLLVAPLHAIDAQVAAERNRSGRKYALLIDALDEASLSGSAGSGSSDLLTLLATSAADLPPWLGIIVTSRPEAAIVAKLARYTPLKMECDSEDNLADLRSFFTHCLRAAHGPRVEAKSASSAPPALTNESALLDLLMTKSAGLFLLGRLMMEQHGLLRSSSGSALGAADDSSERRDYSKQPLSASEVSEWPAGLDAFYFTCMRRVRAAIVTAGGRGAASVEADGRMLPRDLSVLLRITAYVLIAAEPLSLGCVAEMFELKDAAATFRLLAPARALLPIATPEGLSASAAAAISPLCTLSVYHKSVRDWFLAPARLAEAAIDTDAVYAIDELRTQAIITDACWQRLVDADSEPFAVPTLSFSLPALCVDELCAPPDSHSKPESLPSPFLRYAVSFGPTHALSCSETATVCAFLCHPQYLHMRCFLGQGVDVSAEYLAAKAKLNASASAAAASASDASLETSSVARSSSLWISQLPSPSTSLSLFHRAYQSYSAEWFRAAELVYQYNSNFPDDTVVAQLAQACLPWFRSWPHRTHTIARVETKPSVLSDLLSVFHCENVRCLTVSADGTQLLTGEGSAIRIRNAETSAVESTIVMHGFHHKCTCIAVSPDGRWIGVGLSPDSSQFFEGSAWVLVFDALDQSQVCQFAGHVNGMRSVQFDKTSTLLLSKDASKDTIVQICSVRENRVLHSWSSKAYNTNAIARFIDDSPDRILLLNQEVSGHTEVRSFSGEVLHTLPDHTSHWPNASGTKLVSQTWYPKAPEEQSFSLAIVSATGETQLTLPFQSSATCYWSPDDRWLALCADKSVVIHSAITGARLCVLRLSESAVDALFSPDSTRLYARCTEAAFGISVLSMDAARRAEAETHPDAITAVPASVQPAQGSLRPKPATPAAPATAAPVVAGPRKLTNLQLTSDGRLVVVDESRILLLDPLTGAPLLQCSRSSVVQCSLAGPTYVVFSGASSVRALSDAFTAVSLPDWDWDGDTKCSDLSADCSMIAVGRIKDVRVFAVATGAVLHTFPSVSEVTEACAVRFSPNGTKLAAGHADGQFRIWDLQTYGTERPWRSRLRIDVKRPQAVVGLEWNADGTQVLVLLASWFRFHWNGGSACCGVELRSASSGILLKQLHACPHFHRDDVRMSDCIIPSLNVIAWNPQHTMIAACNSEPSLIIWSNEGRVLHSIRLHALGRCIVWHADGKSIYTLTIDSALRYHTLPESLFAATDGVSSSVSSRSAVHSLSAASFDDIAYHRIAYED